MKKTFIFTLLAFATLQLQAQLVGPPSGDNQKARVTQWVGPATITIDYSSPDVHDPSGKDRKGHIWGELAHYGFVDQGFGPSKAAPWRAGANESTVITFSHDVRIGNKTIKAGRYGLFLDVEKSGPWYWVFSRNADAWGSYFYNPAEDVARVEATPQEAPYTEWLTFGFDDRLPASTVAYLQWENKRVSFKVEVPTVNEIWAAEMKKQLEGTATGFAYENWRDAAQFCADNKVSLDQALQWAEAAISAQYVGQENFSTLQTKGNVLRAMGKDQEAGVYYDRAIHHSTATLQNIHQYGRQLLEQGQKAKALEVFKYNYQKHPADKFTVFVGLARGYAANGDTKNAIKNWELALKNVPEDQKQFMPQFKAELDKLKSGK